MEIEEIRQDFPVLRDSTRFIGKWAYFDSACMSLKPRQVIEAINNYYTQMSACSGRSNHRLAGEVAVAVDETREKVRKLIGAERKEEIIFTRNTTEGINLVANTLDLKKGETVIISGKEHNSNLVPWLRLVKNRGIKLKIVPVSDKENTLDLSTYQSYLTQPGVKLVSVGQTSNLDGVTNPIKEMAEGAHRIGAKFMVDGAQSVPHREVKANQIGIDFLAFSGHKMMGPTGTGVLYGKYEYLDKMDSFLVGGDTVSQTSYTDYQTLPLPEKYEAGLQDYAGIIGLGAAVDYLNRIGYQKIREQELKLNQIITEGLSQLDRIQLIGPKESDLRGGIVSFTVEGADAHQVALMLDQTAGIMVRSGQHCVHSWFTDRGIKGSVRASLYVYNTVEEAEYFVDKLTTILKVV